MNININSDENLFPYGKEKWLDEVCAICGGKRGLHNNLNQRCPVNPNASRDHTEYRTTIFKSEDDWMKENPPFGGGNN